MKLVNITLVAAVATTAATAGCGADCGAELGPRLVSPPAIDLVEMPDLELHVGDTVETDLRDYFQPSVCIPGYELWHVTSADSAAVAVSIARGEALVVVALEAADSVLVTVGPAEPASDLEFFVSVRPPPAGR